MVGNFAELKTLCRQTVHDYLAVSALYKDDSLAEPVAITARFHTKLVLSGDLAGTGYAQVIEGAKFVILNRPEVTSVGITPQRGATLTFVDYGITVCLDVLDEADGPIEMKWAVTGE